ncbi:MAG: hypothetical protein HXY20_07235 [Acidobacteria bacterium]|nr:hypothetical protein [Acidobacteriota bacterium]
MTSLLLSLLINSLLLAGIVVYSEISALRHSYRRLLDRARWEIGQYRIVLVSPRLAQAKAPQTPPKDADRLRRRKVAAQPLTVPNPRLLRRLNPGIQALVLENPAIESIITREIVRDVDNRVLDVRRLLEKSNIELSLELDGEGRLAARRIDSSSGVPSIDHLGLELIALLEKYRFLWLFRGFRRVGLRIDIGSDVEITARCAVEEPDRLEEALKQADRMLAVLRLLAAQNEAEAMLQGVEITAEEKNITLRKRVPKDRIVEALVRYYMADAAR